MRPENQERGARLAGLWPAAPPSRGKLAVALHDVEPATFERCTALRQWLQERGVDRVTLLVIPARDLHPLGERSPELARWLASRRDLGDSIAQHGFQHVQLRTRWPRRIPAPAQAKRAREFVGLDEDETRRAVEAGWRVMKLAGIEPDGFVAPAYAYTPALRQALDRFRWWADRFGVQVGAGPTAHRVRPASHRRGAAWGRLTPAWGLRTIRVGAPAAGDILRLDLTPAQLHPHQLRKLERTLARVARRRTAVTYDELASLPLHAENTEASSELRPRVAA